jgi:hypothetical protein
MFEVLKDLEKINFVKFHDGVPLSASADKRVIKLLQTLKVGENTVLVVGYPKSGSHFLLQILENLGEYILGGDII